MMGHHTNKIDTLTKSVTGIDGRKETGLMWVLGFFDVFFEMSDRVFLSAEINFVLFLRLVPKLILFLRLVTVTFLSVSVVNVFQFVFHTRILGCYKFKKVYGDMFVSE